MGPVCHFHRLVVDEMAMKRRGQIVKLQNVDTEKVVKVKVIWGDSIQGYLAEDSNGKWDRYPLSLWKEIKK